MPPTPIVPGSTPPWPGSMTIIGSPGDAACGGGGGTTSATSVLAAGTALSGAPPNGLPPRPVTTRAHAPTVAAIPAAGAADAATTGPVAGTATGTGGGAGAGSAAVVAGAGSN